MGPFYATAYVNIFISEFQEKYINPLIKEKSIYPFMHIMIRTETEEKLKNFRNILHLLDLGFPKIKNNFPGISENKNNRS